MSRHTSISIDYRHVVEPGIPHSDVTDAGVLRFRCDGVEDVPRRRGDGR
jgi:hypothetical protein